MDDTKKSRLIFPSLLIICLLTIGFAIWLHSTRHQEQQKTITLQQGTAFPKAIAIQAFRLVDGDNKQFTNKDLTGRWSLLFFGFTHCHKICPTTLSELNKTYQILQKTDASNLPQVVFISIDPERDSPKVIRQYVMSFNKHFIGTTGSKSALDRLTKNLGIMYAAAKKSNEKDYQVNHSSTILVINPKGQWAGILTPPFNAKVMATDFMAIQRSK